MKLIFALLVICISTSAIADTYVKGYTRKDGTYVQGHTRSSPDAYRYNNSGSQSYGGNQRDEYSNQGGATNKGNSSYGLYDNDGDGISNAYDSKPESKSGW